MCHVAMPKGTFCLNINFKAKCMVTVWVWCRNLFFTNYALLHAVTCLCFIFLGMVLFFNK